MWDAHLCDNQSTHNGKLIYSFFFLRIVQFDVSQLLFSIFSLSCAWVHGAFSWHNQKEENEHAHERSTIGLLHFYRLLRWTRQNALTAFDCTLLLYAQYTFQTHSNILTTRRNPELLIRTKNRFICFLSRNFLIALTSFIWNFPLNIDMQPKIMQRTVFNRKNLTFAFV